jgi:uncharacterized membrane-anchored protein
VKIEQKSWVHHGPGDMRFTVCAKPSPHNASMGTLTVRKLFKMRAARTPEEIAARLATLARRLQRSVSKGKGIDVEEAQQIAKKLATYATRLQAPVNLHDVPADPPFPIIQGK